MIKNKNNKINIVFLGVNNAGQKIYNWLLENNENVVALLTSKNQLDLIKKLKPDMVISCGFRYIVPQEYLEIPPLGCINIHSSYLPYNRGANPNIWSIIENTPAGATIHFMDKGIDTGDIIARRNVEIQFSDNAADLYDKLEKAQFNLFVENWKKIKKRDFTTISQSLKEGTSHKVKDFIKLCEINLNETRNVREIINQFRALTFPPYDNAYVEIDGQRYYVKIEIYKEKDK